MKIDNRDLIVELEKSRAILADHVSNIGEALDVPKRVVRKLREQPRWVYWVGGTVLVGAVVLTACIPRRKYYHPPVAVAPAVTSRTLTALGVALGIAKIAFPIVRPALTTYATKALANITKNRMR